MERSEIIRIRDLQNQYFLSGKTLDVKHRVSALKTLKAAIRRYEDELCQALQADLGKSAYESFMCEIGMVYDEISYMVRHTPKFAKEKRVRTPLAQFHSRSFAKPSPLGTVLIMSPWNYPFLLTMDPLVDALAAGNTAMVKPSAYSKETSRVIQKIIEACFPEDYVAVVTGGRQENQYLLDEKFDFIFFTGGTTVGKLVMQKSAEHLTPFALEMGGKSPCIVDKTANISLAARRIVFGKFMNVGQTCVAPDYIYCHESVKDELVEALKQETIRQYTNRPLANPDYGKIINEKHFQRLKGLIQPEKVVLGGGSNPDTLQIEPTIMDHVKWTDPVMGEEIFGPIMPILTYSSTEEAVQTLNRMPHPLAFYVFTGKNKVAEYFLSRCRFGGGCVNDTIIHIATNKLGFGGVGDSGIGSYHGKWGFDTFSHYKGIVDKKTWLDLPMRYQPYKDIYGKVLHVLFR